MSFQEGDRVIFAWDKKVVDTNGRFINIRNWRKKHGYPIVKFYVVVKSSLHQSKIERPDGHTETWANEHLILYQDPPPKRRYASRKKILTMSPQELIERYS